MPLSEERMTNDRTTLTIPAKKDSETTRDTDDDTSILLMDSTGSSCSNNSTGVNGDCCYSVDSYFQSDHYQAKNRSMVSEGFASHDSCSLDFHHQQQQQLVAPVNDDHDTNTVGKQYNAEKNKAIDYGIDMGEDVNHRIVLYYNSASTTKTLSLYEIRARLETNLEFLKVFKAQFGPFLDANSAHFNIEYRDVSDQETRRLLVEQFGSDDGDGSSDNDDGDSATVVTTSSLLVSLPAVVIDNRIMIPYSEADWSTIVMDYMNLLLNLIHATVPDDASLTSHSWDQHEIDSIGRSDTDDSDCGDEELTGDKFDRHELLLETSENDASEIENSDSYGDFDDMEQYYEETSTSTTKDLLGRNKTATTICTTTNDSAESSVTQVTTNLTQRTTSSSRMVSLLDMPDESSHDIEKIIENSYIKEKKVKTIAPTKANPPTGTIQFSSNENPDSHDQTSFSTLSYTISSEVKAANIVKVEKKVLSPIKASPVASKTPTTRNDHANVATRIVGTVEHHPGQRSLTIPLTKQTITVAAITRQLMNITTHRYQYIPESSSTTWQNSFRGFEGIIIWKNLYGKQNMNTINAKGKPATTAAAAANDDKWIEFGLLLLSSGILHDYTPNESDFRRTYLAVQPLRNPFALNTLLQWAPLKRRNKVAFDGDGQSTDVDSALSTVLRLSRSMDALVQRFTSNPTTINHLFEEYEQAVCQIQVITLPTESTTTKMAIVLNLFNMIVRHAMLLTLTKKRKGWTWPTSLEDLDHFFVKIGYVIDGTFVSASTLQGYIFSGNYQIISKPNSTVVKDLTNRNGMWPGKTCLVGRRAVVTERSMLPSVLGINCMGGGAAHRWKHGSDEENIYYEKNRILTDNRVLMAMTWGTNISPSILTIYPDRFEETLRAASEHYCQAHITINQNEDALSLPGVTTTVTIPSLFSWYRNDFGIYRENILEGIKDYLSVTQREQICKTQNIGKLRIVFGGTSPANWQCNFPAIDPSVAATIVPVRAIKTSTFPIPVSLSQMDSRTPEKLPNSRAQSATDRSKTTKELSLVNREISRCTKDIVFTKEMRAGTIPTKMPVEEKMASPLKKVPQKLKEIVPEQRTDKKPRTSVQDSINPLKYISKDKNASRKDFSKDKKSSQKEPITASSRYSDIYLAQLPTTGTEIEELDMKHPYNPYENAEQDVAKIPSALKTENAKQGVTMIPSALRTQDAARDIVVSGLYKPNHRPTAIKSKLNSDKHSKHGGPTEDCKTAGRPSLRVVKQAVETASSHKNRSKTPLQRSPTGVTSCEIGQAPKPGNDSVALIQQWIGYTQSEPSKARQASQGDSILMQNIQAPPSARQASLGDLMLFPPVGRSKNIPSGAPPRPDKAKVEYFLPTTQNVTPPKHDKAKVNYFLTTQNRNQNVLYEADRPMDDSDLGGQSFTFRSDISAITYGSDFDAMVRMNNSLPQLVYPATTSSTINNLPQLVYPGISSSPMMMNNGQQLMMMNNGQQLLRYPVPAETASPKGAVMDYQFTFPHLQ